MHTLAMLALAALVAFAIIFVIWRLASRRHTIPCPSWLGWLVELDNPFAKENRAAVIIGHLNLKKGMTVLDVGCGPGRLTIPLAKRVGPDGEVVAMDLQEEMLERVHQKARAAHLSNIRFENVPVGQEMFPPHQADKVVLVTVLGEIPNREAAMKELYGALKPGGILSVTEIIFDPHFQSAKTVRRLASAAGFRESAFYGNKLAYTLCFEKSGGSAPRALAERMHTSPVTTTTDTPRLGA